jgi:hypothetical protein
MPSVSHSEVDSYLLCRRKHYYGYGLSLERISTSQSLATGTAGHRILEAFYAHLLSLSDTAEGQLENFDLGLERAQAVYREVVDEGYTDANNRALLYDMLFHEEWGYFANEFIGAKRLESISCRARVQPYLRRQTQTAATHSLST